MGNSRIVKQTEKDRNSLDQISDMEKKYVKKIISHSRNPETKEAICLRKNRLEEKKRRF